MLIKLTIRKQKYIAKMVCLGQGKLIRRLQRQRGTKVSITCYKEGYPLKIKKLYMLRHPN